MKRLFITLAISAASIFSSKAAGPITPQVVESFRNNYYNATEVQWTDIGSKFKVSFKLDGQFVTAYYNEDGSWIGTTRNISPVELTHRLRSNLRKEAKAGYVSDLFVMTSAEGDVYFATIETPDTKEVLKSVNGKSWSSYKKVDKS